MGSSDSKTETNASSSSSSSPCLIRRKDESRRESVDWTFLKVFPNGDKYNGDWEDNQPHGRGSLTYSTAEPNEVMKYVGDWH